MVRYHRLLQKMVYMDKDALFQQLKKEHEKLRWAALSFDPEFVQLCHEIVESNAKRIEKALGSISKLNEAYEFFVSHKEVCFPDANEETWDETREFKQTMQEVVCHFCECLDAQSNFLLMNKNALISQNDVEKSLIYRHIQVDIVRVFQRLHYIDKYIRKNDGMFAVEEQRRECNKQKSELNKKYGIEQGSLHDERNKSAAHWDKEVDYIDLYERSKTVRYDQILEICSDMYNLTYSYSQCLHTALKNYMKSVKKEDNN